MFIKMFRSLTIFCLLAIICASGFIVLNNAQGEGKGYECQGRIWSEWTDDCGSHDGNSTACNNASGTLVGKSSKNCKYTENESDYCKMKKGPATDGSRSCSWEQKGKKCKNPTITNSKQVDDC